MSKILPVVFSGIGLFVVLFMAYTVFIWGPMFVYTEADCLSKGYPEYKLSVGLERYCMNLDGSVIVRVDRQ